MVGYKPDEIIQLSKSEQAVAGAITGAVSRFLFQPFDVLKIRFQLQVEPLVKRSTSKYWSISQATKSIIVEEGVTALWKGHVPAQILSVLYGTVQFVTFEVTTKAAWYILPGDLYLHHKSLTHTVCGAMAGCMATFFIQPVDVIRTRLISQGKKKIYSSMLNGISTILHNEGISGLYRGLVPAVSQIAPQMGLQFGFYSLFLDVWGKYIKKSQINSTDSTASLVCGSGSGVVSKVIIYPLDVVKKRLQVQGFEHARREFGDTRTYSGLCDCFSKVVKEEGMRGLYKGLAPSLWKAGFVSGASFLVYEKVCDVFRYKKRMSSLDS